MRVDDVAADGLGDAHAHQTFSLLGKPSTDFHDRLRRAHHIPAALIHLLPAIAQAQFAGGALQQTDGQCLFQPGNAAAHRRGRGAQLPRRFRKIPGLDHLHENRHFGQ